jgi:hypothetical protein
MTIKRFSLVLFLLPFLAFIPGDDDPFDKLFTALANWSKVNPIEKVYLHTDKPYYALGDTIWFKAYVTVGSRHQLSALSGALYVDLVDEKDSILRTLKLPVSAGTSQGDFALKEEWKEGNYRIRAYTQWMRNAGADYFYDEFISIGNPTDDAEGDSKLKSTDSKIKPQNAKGEIKSSSDAYDIQFFPEGGNLINGVISKVAFKAVAATGFGVELKGVVVDDQNANIADFTTVHVGIGNFTFKPEKGRRYSAKVRLPDGKEQTIPLPKATDEGYSLGIFQTAGSDSLLVRVNVSDSQLKLLSQNPSPLSLIVQSGGVPIYTLRVTITGLVNSIWLKKNDFPMGIAQFTLFNNKIEPLNERIAFVRNGDKMDISVSSPKTVYKSKEKVELQLLSKAADGSPVPGSFSIAVTDERKVPVDEADESTIFSNILLKSDLKGHIERPNYYFTGDTEKINSALDNLMLTQGYTRFNWKAIASDSVGVPAFKAEQLGSSISGIVKSLNNKVFPGAKVKMFSLRSGIMLDAVSNMEGRFSFDNLVLTDSIKLTLQALTLKNSKKLELLVDNTPVMNLTKRKVKGSDSLIVGYAMNTYLENIAKQDALVEKMGGLSRVQRLKEVTITARKIASQQYSAQGMFRVPEGHADQTFFLTNAENCANLGTCLQGMLGGVVFQANSSALHYPYFRNEPMTVMLDGRKLNADEIADVFDNNVISPTDIGRIDVVRTNLALISMLNSGPTLLIVTKRGYLRKTYQPNLVNISPKGFNKVREFYTPKYDRPGNANTIPDLRSTIYWNANVKTVTTGKASLSFFNADGPGDYKVVVEGINADGELGRQVFRYKVEAGDQQMQTIFAKIDKNLATKGLDSLNLKLPVERVYLHLDKTAYNMGDTLWFKGYVTGGSSLAATKLSGVLIVELNNDSAEVVRRISVPIKKGIAMAQIPLPAKIFREGAYTIRAYTNWMQNFGESHYFSQRFYMGLPRADRWLVKSAAMIDSTEKNDVLKVDMSLFRLDRTPVALRDVEAYIYEGDWYLYKEKLQTGADGIIQFSKALPKRANGKNLRIELRSVHPSDKSQVVQVPLLVERAHKIDLQFMPDGGKLVSGIRSVVGFKALAENGRGVTVEGHILDRNDKVVSKFSTSHNGMGSFEFTPVAGENYRAKITRPVGAVKNYDLPKIAKEGSVMSIQNLPESEFLTVKILGSVKGFDLDSAYYLIGTTRGKVYFSEKLSPKVQTLSIPKSTFPTGISRFTLLKGIEPMNERIVFINHKEELVVSISAGKTDFSKRSPIDLEVKVTDKRGMPVAGNFSLSVTDDSQIQADSLGNRGISASLLINSDLKGNVESPAYYLGNGNTVAADLDNLMLTQGWTDYDWKDVFKLPKKIPFAIEDGFRITGLVKNLSDKPVIGAQVIISSRKPSFLNATVTDGTGRYTFQDLPKIDTGSFFIQARNVKGKTMVTGTVTVDRFEPARLPLGGATIEMPWYVNSDSTQLRNYINRLPEKSPEDSFVGDGRQLKEVNISAVKIIKSSQNPYGPGKADIVLDANDIKESGTANLYQLLKQKVTGFRVIYDYENMRGRATLRVGKYVVSETDINIDGRPLQLAIDGYPTIEKVKDALAEYVLGSIIGLEVIYSRKFTVGTVYAWTLEHDKVIPQVGFRDYDFAKIEITTLNGRGWYRPKNADVVYYRPLPILSAKEFYSPKYIIPLSKDAPIDNRSTIFWEPALLTDNEGKAKVSFYSSDAIGSYTISVEGSDMRGSFGTLRKKIAVKK